MLLKYWLQNAETQIVRWPRHAQVLLVRTQNGRPFVIVTADSDADHAPVRIRTLATNAIPEEGEILIGSYERDLGAGPETVNVYVKP